MKETSGQCPINNFEAYYLIPEARFDVASGVGKYWVKCYGAKDEMTRVAEEIDYLPFTDAYTARYLHSLILLGVIDPWVVKTAVSSFGVPGILSVKRYGLDYILGQKHVSQGEHIRALRLGGSTRKFVAHLKNFSWHIDKDDSLWTWDQLATDWARRFEIHDFDAKLTSVEDFVLGYRKRVTSLGLRYFDELGKSNFSQLFGQPDFDLLPENWSAYLRAKMRKVGEGFDGLPVMKRVRLLASEVLIQHFLVERWVAGSSVAQYEIGKISQLVSQMHRVVDGETVDKRADIALILAQVELNSAVGLLTDSGISDPGRHKGRRITHKRHHAVLINQGKTLINVDLWRNWQINGNNIRPIGGCPFLQDVVMEI